MGYDFAQVQDYMEDKGLCELRHDLLVDSINHRNFHNPLFIKQEEDIGENDNDISYGYFNPGAVSSAPKG